MIKNIIVVPRFVVSEIVKKEREPLVKNRSWALISMHTTPEEKLITDDKLPILAELQCNDVLSICCGDFTVEKWNRYSKDHPFAVENSRLFDITDAHKVIKFVNMVNAEPISTLVVHCDAGVSRSGAVGTFVCRYLGLDEHTFKKLNYSILPNMYIYDMLADVAGLKKDYESWWDSMPLGGGFIINSTKPEDIF